MVPRTSRKRMIEALHGAHSKGGSMYKTAREKLMWPTMKEELKRKAKECLSCKENDPIQEKGKPNMETPDLSELDPCDHLNMDLFTLQGRHYLIIVDKASSYIKV